MNHPVERVREQIAAILRAWGMPETQIATSLNAMLWADLAGVDSHGISMLPPYADWRKAGKLDLKAAPKLVRESASTALLDGGGNLGHHVSTVAMHKAIEKAKVADVGVVAVRNSHHYGAAGVYAMMAADAGLIGVSTTNVHLPTTVPLWGADPMFGTNPIAFAAPAKRNKPFLLDMATSSAAIGKIKLALYAGRPIPEGWAVDAQGRPLTDAEAAFKDRRLVPLGGTRELGGHKGYGLAIMVEILSATLPGALFGFLRMTRDPAALRPNVGHFFMALNPSAFREEGEFERDLDDMMDALRATRPADSACPVLVPGDPEHEETERRRRDGIPIPPMLADQLRAICAECGADYLLG